MRSPRLRIQYFSELMHWRSVTRQNLYDWSKAALTSKTDECKKANREKLATVGLVTAFSPENKAAWIAKMSLNPEPIS